MKTSPRLKIFRTRKQRVETLSPLKEEVGDDIPSYTKLTYKHRKRWRCNRCLRRFYPLLRTLYVAFWFYYIPFLALTVNFSVPYLAEKLGGALTVPEAGNMSTEYEEWIASTLAADDGSPAYDEPSLEELVKMMDEIPL